MLELGTQVPRYGSKVFRPRTATKGTSQLEQPNHNIEFDCPSLATELGRKTSSTTKSESRALPKYVDIVEVPPNVLAVRHSFHGRFSEPDNAR